VPRLMHIIDLSGVSVRHFWALRAHLQKLGGMATAHYPEAVEGIFVSLCPFARLVSSPRARQCLGPMHGYFVGRRVTTGVQDPALTCHFFQIIGAPSFFPTIWGYINAWFSPSLTSKIAVLPTKDAFATLARHIDPENIPVFAGGALEWDYNMPPNLDEEAAQLVGERLAADWIEGPLKVVCDEEGDRVVMAGIEGKRARTGVVVALAGGDGGSISSGDVLS
jgi:hypothetical protein